MAFETLKVSQEGAVLFAEIAAPPMNLLGPELVLRTTFRTRRGRRAIATLYTIDSAARIFFRAVGTCYV
jgi:hypothetical protein